MTVKLLDFYADWCGPCKMQDSILDEVVKDIEVDVEKIDVEQNRGIANKFEVQALPTLLLVDSDSDDLSDDLSEVNEVLERFVGVTDKSELIATIENLDG